MSPRPLVALFAALFVLLALTQNSAQAQAPAGSTYTVPVTVGGTTAVLVITIDADGAPTVTSNTPNVAVGTPLLVSSGAGSGATRSTTLGDAPVVRRTGNLRSGPATSQAVVGSVRSGDVLEIIGASADGQWYALASGAWISASLVQNAPARELLTVITAPPASGAQQSAAAEPVATVTTRAVTTLPTATPAPVTGAAPATRSDGGSLVVVSLDKSAEYAVIENRGAEAVNLGGWVLRSERGMQDCALSGTIEAGAQLVISAMGAQAGFNCGFESNIWNNSERDAAVLLAPGGVEVSRLE